MERDLGYNIYDLLPTPPAVGSYFNSALTGGNKDYSNQFTEGVSLSSMRDSQVGGDMRSANYVSASDGWIIYANGDVEFNDGTFRGTLVATAGTIGGFNIGSDYIRDVADSFGMASTVSGSDDVRFWAGDTYANRATADFRVTEAGAVVCSNITITGGAVSGASIASIPNNTTTDISLLQFSQNLSFTSSDADTIAWGTGTIVMSHGRTFTIDAGNTGNMAALTYIYLDTAVSSTVLQTTTTYSTATGANKIIIAVAQNHTISASVIPFGGGQPLLDGSTQINALSIVAGNIAASTITAGKLSVSQLSAITADLGTITAGTVTGATIQTASSGTRFVMTSTAFQGIDSGGDVVFEVIISGGDAGDVIMGDDATGNYAKWDNSAGTLDIFKGGSTITKFGGTGTDGALSISSGTTDINCGGARVLVKNYTSISITGTANVTFSNKHANGTIIIFKSQGNVTITTSGSISGSGGGANASTNGQTSIYLSLTNKGGNGSPTVPAAGVGGAALSSYIPDISLKTIPLACGAGGGTQVYDAGTNRNTPGGGGASLIEAGDAGESTGTAGSNNDGDGGAGGAAFYIECAGAYNFTTGTINMSGVVGQDSDNTSLSGGGGGGGGCVVVLYNSLTADSGTYNVAGGLGGNQSSSHSGGQGGDGYTLRALNTIFA